MTHPAIPASLEALFAEFSDGRSDLVFELVAQGCAVDARDQQGVSLVEHCAYFGDVSAIRFLLSKGASLAVLGDDLGLNGAAFHGHWRLVKFLIEKGADANFTDSATGETVLHSALVSTDRVKYDRVLRILLAHGADPNRSTVPGVETGAFMRDCRTKGETPLHRAAAFGQAETIQMLLEAGAVLDAKDAYGDTPLGWASWYQRPTPILRLLLHGNFRIHPKNRGMQENLLGDPRV